MADPLADQPLTSTTTSSLILSTPPHDPPPPYPSRERRIRSPRTGRRRRTVGQDSEHPQIPTNSTESDRESQHFLGSDDQDTTETTPLLLSTATSPRILHGTIGRQRTLSITSTLRSSVSAAPSFAQTVLSAFHPDRDSDLDPECAENVDGVEGEARFDSVESQLNVDEDQQQFLSPDSYSPRLGRRRQSYGAAWRKYFRPLGRRPYYSALFHLLLLNFPYALVAWVYLFVFTLAGTTTLMALPIGAVLCFVDLIGARTFARGELALQTTFHGPLSFPAPYPPHPIFTRQRPPTTAEIEAGTSGPMHERSFYRNAYSMFADSTSYQALFYFLVIKPGITILLSLLLVTLVPVSFILILPAPAMLRLVRRLGIWQANVAVEGLYYAVG